MSFKKNGNTKYTKERRKHIPTGFGADQSRNVIKKAIFLDRDGVIVEDTGYISSPGELILFPDIIPVLKKLQHCFRLIVVTNQSGVARGYFTEEDLFVINERVIQMLAHHSVGLDAIYYCPHHPQVGNDEYRIKCECRKPKAGLLRLAAEEFGIELEKSFLIGDQETDIQAGRAIGIKTIKINRNERESPEDESGADYIVKTFNEVSEIIK
jgi:D-glycero-D-manno-heptose 1,7-bisphosphate phosphatase